MTSPRQPADVRSIYFRLNLRRPAPRSGFEPLDDGTQRTVTPSACGFAPNPDILRKFPVLFSRELRQKWPRYQPDIDSGDSLPGAESRAIPVLSPRNRDICGHISRDSGAQDSAHRQKVLSRVLRSLVRPNLADSPREMATSGSTEGTWREPDAQDSSDSRGFSLPRFGPVHIREPRSAKRRRRQSVLRFSGPCSRRPSTFSGRRHAPSRHF